MKTCLLIAVILSNVSLRMDAAEILNPTNFIGSVVSVTRNFTPEEIARDPFHPVGICATAWFYGSGKFLVTAGHFSRDSFISMTNWIEVVLTQEASDGWLIERRLSAQIGFLDGVSGQGRCPI
jgi:hypothetical protein